MITVPLDLTDCLDHRTLARLACIIARATLTGDDDRPRRAIETAERWLDGQATVAELQRAKSAAFAAGGSPAAAYAAGTTVGCTDPIGLGHYVWSYFVATLRAAGVTR